MFETFGSYIDGYLVEYLYDPQEQRASLAWRDPEGNIGTGDGVEINGEYYVAYPPDEAVKNGSVIFPSRLGEQMSATKIIDSLNEYFNSVFLFEDEATCRMTAYYAFLTWFYDGFDNFLYFMINGDIGSGKSELAKRMGLVCRRTTTTNGARSASYLMGILERYKGTAYIDESEVVFFKDNDMMKFLNLGVTRGAEFEKIVTRTKPREISVTFNYQTYGPKIIVSRKRGNDDALIGRCLHIRLNNTEITNVVNKGISLSIDQSMRERAEEIRNMLLRYRLETWQPDFEYRELYDPEIRPRLSQVCAQLLAITEGDLDAQGIIRDFMKTIDSIQK